MRSLQFFGASHGWLFQNFVLPKKWRSRSEQDVSDGRLRISPLVRRAARDSLDTRDPRSLGACRRTAREKNARRAREAGAARIWTHRSRAALRRAIRAWDRRRTSR